jgi:prephenate dehydratase
VFAAVSAGLAERGVIPLENSLAGPIPGNSELLRASCLRRVAETVVRVRHCLIARPGAELVTIRRVASHPVALGQCRRFFAEHPELEAVVAWDTAGSVRDLMQDESAEHAAIAGALAAGLYGARILLEGIEDDPGNYTRFCVIGRES